MTSPAPTDDRNRRRIVSLRLLASFPRLLAKRSEQQLLGERDAFEFEELNVFFHSTIERKADLPRPREHLRILDRGLVHEVVRTDGGVALRSEEHTSELQSLTNLV